MTGVVFSHSRISLQLWFYAMLLFADSAEGISTSFLARQLGFSDRTAFRISQRIRLHLAALEASPLCVADGGPIVVQLARLRRIVNMQRNATNTATLLLINDRERVNAFAIKDVTQRILRIHLRPYLQARHRIVTDCPWTYRVMRNYSSGTPLADFDPTYFLERAPGENINHGFMQYLNLSFADQYRGVTLANAWLYLREYQFRYNRRHQSATTFWDMVAHFPLLDEMNLARLTSINLLGCRTD
jgi:hypothetical protein